MIRLLNVAVNQASGTSCLPGLCQQGLSDYFSYASMQRSIQIPAHEPNISFKNRFIYTVMTYIRITYIIKDDSSLPSGKGQSAAEGEQVSMKMKKVLRDLVPFLVSS